VVRRINGDVIFRREIGQHLTDIVDAAVMVFLDRVGFHKRVEYDQINLARHDDGLQTGGKSSDDRVSFLVGDHDLACASAGCG
jgi:hypothetical protein